MPTPSSPNPRRPNPPDDGPRSRRRQDTQESIEKARNHIARALSEWTDELYSQQEHRDVDARAIRDLAMALEALD
jgi:hypothetical protein